MHPTQSELYLYLAGRMAGDRSGVMEDHLIDCVPCRDLLASVAKILREVPSEDPFSGEYPEKRKEQRIPASDVGLVRTICPIFSTRVEYQLVDVSRSGLKIRTLLGFEPGAIVQLSLGSQFILAEVRHCHDDEGVYYSGLQIVDVQSHHGSNSLPDAQHVAEEEGFEPPSESPR